MILLVDQLSIGRADIGLSLSEKKERLAKVKKIVTDSADWYGIIETICEKLNYAKSSVTVRAFLTLFKKLKKVQDKEQPHY